MLFRSVVLGAVYMLHAVLKMFWGPLDKPENQGLADLTGREGLVLAPLVLLIFWMGLYPKPMLSRMEASVDAMAHEYKAKLVESDRNPEVRGLLKAHLVPVGGGGGGDGGDQAGEEAAP